MILWSILACQTKPAQKPPPPSETTPETTPPIPDTETAQTASTGETAATGDTAAPFDCSVPPPIPVTFQSTSTFTTAEDFDFDGDGYLCSIDNSNLTCRDMYGNFKVVGVNVVSWSAGTRILPTGDWVIADAGRGALVRVDTASGASTAVVGDLAYPNGVEVGRDGWVFVAENSGAALRQIDPYTGEQHIVARGLVQPNGVILSPDEQTLYVGSFGGGMVYAIDRLGDTSWDEERILWQAPFPDGGFDGINVDSCGYVYITEYTTGRVMRLGEDPSVNGLVASLPAGWIPNMRWGHGIGGWDTHTLYVSAFSEIFGLDMGVEGKRHVLLP